MGEDIRKLIDQVPTIKDVMIAVWITLLFVP